MNEPNLSELAKRYPHLYLTEEKLALKYSSDQVRQAIVYKIEDQKGKIEEYRNRITSFQSQEAAYQAEILRVKSELRLQLKRLDTERRIAKGNVKSAQFMITRAGKMISRLKQRYALRNIQIFRNIVNKRLAEEGRVLRLRRGRRAAMGLPEAEIQIPFPSNPDNED